MWSSGLFLPYCSSCDVDDIKNGFCGGRGQVSVRGWGVAVDRQTALLPLSRQVPNKLPNNAPPNKRSPIYIQYPTVPYMNTTMTIRPLTACNQMQRVKQNSGSFFLASTREGTYKFDIDYYYHYHAIPSSGQPQEPFPRTAAHPPEFIHGAAAEAAAARRANNHHNW